MKEDASGRLCGSLIMMRGSVPHVSNPSSGQIPHVAGLQRRGKGIGNEAAEGTTITFLIYPSRWVPAGGRGGCVAEELLRLRRCH